MKFLELDMGKLTDEDIYDLVMNDVIDYAKEKPDEKNHADFLVVLGASPIALKSRVVKMMELYKKGFGDNVLLSGGTGWHRLFKVTDKEFKNAGDKITSIHKKAQKRKEIKRALDGALLDLSDDKKLELRNSQGNRAVHVLYSQKLNSTEAEIAYQMMKAAQSVVNIPDDKIFFEQKSVNTIENLEYSKNLIDGLQSDGKIDKIKNIMIITSSFHCRRAVLSFKKYFPDVNVNACPATLDIKERNVEFDKASLMNNQYYMGQFRGELGRIIKYMKKNESTDEKERKGAIAEADIEEFISDKKILRRIYEHQGLEWHGQGDDVER